MKTRYTNVRAVFRAAVRDGLIATDPTDGVRCPDSAGGRPPWPFPNPNRRAWR